MSDKHEPLSAAEPQYTWDSCPEHAWEERESQFSNEKEADVSCTRCGMPGSQDRETGDVYYPAS